MMQNPYAKPTDTYKSQQIKMASQEQILIMLYEGAIRFLNLAKEGLAANDIEKLHVNILKCQRIVTEFMETLDMQDGQEVTKNLMSLYEYLNYRLIQANVKRDPQMIEEVLNHLRKLKDTWEKAIAIANHEKAAKAGGSSKNVYSA